MVLSCNSARITLGTSCSIFSRTLSFNQHLRILPQELSWYLPVVTEQAKLTLTNTPLRRVNKMLEQPTDKPKTTKIWTLNEIERRFGSDDLDSYSLHSENIAISLQQHVGDSLRINRILYRIWRTLPSLLSKRQLPLFWQLFLCLGRPTEVYIWKTEIIDHLPVNAYPLDYSYAPWVYDVEKAERLYKLSIQLVQSDK